MRWFCVNKTSHYYIPENGHGTHVNLQPHERCALTCGALWCQSPPVRGGGGASSAASPRAWLPSVFLPQPSSQLRPQSHKMAADAHICSGRKKEEKGRGAKWAPVSPTESPCWRDFMHLHSWNPQLLLHWPPLTAAETRKCILLPERAVTSNTESPETKEEARHARAGEGSHYC